MLKYANMLVENPHAFGFQNMLIFLKKHIYMLVGRPAQNMSILVHLMAPL